jgi:hypothetical protein
MALSCYGPSLGEEVMMAAGVFEATVASRRPFAPLLFAALEWLGVPITNRFDHLVLSLEDVQPLRGAASSTIHTAYDFPQPGSSGWRWSGNWRFC